MCIYICIQICIFIFNVSFCLLFIPMVYFADQLESIMKLRGITVMHILQYIALFLLINTLLFVQCAPYIQCVLFSNLLGSFCRRPTPTVIVRIFFIVCFFIFIFTFLSFNIFIFIYLLLFFTFKSTGNRRISLYFFLWEH